MGWGSKDPNAPVEESDYMVKKKFGGMDLQTLDPEFMGGKPYEDWKKGDRKAGAAISGGYAREDTGFWGSKQTIDPVTGDPIAIGMKGATQDIGKEFSRLKGRAARDVELSDAYAKAEEVIGTKELQDISKAGAKGERAVTSAMAGQEMRGAGGGGARERMVGKISSASEAEKQAMKAGTSTLMGELAAADLQSGQKRKFKLEDQLMPGAEKVLKAQGFQAGMELRQAAAQRPDIDWQRNVTASNNQMLNQAELARHGYDVSMAAAQKQSNAQNLSTGLQILGLFL